MAEMFDWIDRCLLCLENAEVKIDIFDSQSQSTYIRRMMVEFLNITVEETDNYPKQICEICCDILQKVNDLKVRSHESQLTLLKLQNAQWYGEQDDSRTEYVRLWLNSQSPLEYETEVYDGTQQQACQKNSTGLQGQYVSAYSQMLTEEDRMLTVSKDPGCSTVLNRNGSQGSLENHESGEVPGSKTFRSGYEMVHQDGIDVGAQCPKRKRAGTPLPISNPSSRSGSPQPGSLPPESSKKRSSRPRFKNRSKALEQQSEIDESPGHSGSPQPGALPPESTGKHRKQLNRSVQSESASHSQSSLLVSPRRSELGQQHLFHRAQSCSPPRLHDSSAGGRARLRSRLQNHKEPLNIKSSDKQQSRYRSRSVPATKRPKLDSSQSSNKQEQPANLNGQHTSKWRIRLAAPKPKSKCQSQDSSVTDSEDMICISRTPSISYNLEDFERRIPVVKLIKWDIVKPVTKSKCTLPQLPKFLVEKSKDFSLVEDVQEETSGVMQQFCCLCSKYLCSSENVEQHLMIHRDRQFANSTSKNKLKDPTALRKESMTPGSKRPDHIECNICCTHFTTRRSLKRHMNGHLERKWTNECEKCEQTFPNRIILARHLKSHILKCQACDEVFSSTEELESHQKVHEEKGEFSGKDALSEHMLQHRKCSLCNKTFVDKDKLAAHVSSSHQVCSICGETVADEEDLISHIETNHETCNLCGKQFLGEDELGGHLSTHPYQCMLCLSAFNEKAQRNEHFKVSHKEMLQLVKETLALESSVA